ncbi:MAG: hypothetical protein JWQ11_62, partial [Rhizobacter sp.]|nr:hypothetical protein [Rhizobacter sp.]
AVFSHGMTIKTFLYSVLGLRTTAHSLLTLDHCSVSRLVGDRLGGLRVVSINESLGIPPI